MDWEGVGWAARARAAAGSGGWEHEAPARARVGLAGVGWSAMAAVASWEAARLEPAMAAEEAKVVMERETPAALPGVAESWGATAPAEGKTGEAASVAQVAVAEGAGKAAGEAMAAWVCSAAEGLRWERARECQEAAGCCLGSGWERLAEAVGRWATGWECLEEAGQRRESGWERLGLARAAREEAATAEGRRVPARARPTAEPEPEAARRPAPAQLGGPAVAWSPAAATAMQGPGRCG